MNSEFYLKRFIIGSSLPCFILPSALMSVSCKHENIDLEKVTLLISVSIGLVNAILPLFMPRQSDEVVSLCENAFVGVLFGLAVATVDTLAFDQGFCKLYGLKERNKWLAFVFEPLLYSIIFGLVLPYLNTLFQLNTGRPIF